MVAELDCKQVVSSECKLQCWHGLLARQHPVCSSSIFVWLPRPLVQQHQLWKRWQHREAQRSQTTTLETNSVSDRAARLDAEQHVMVKRQRFTRNSSTQVQAPSSRLNDTKVCRKSGKPSLLSYRHVAAHRPVGQEVDERREERICVGNYCHDCVLGKWPAEGQQLRSSCSNRVGLLDWNRYALELDPRASSTAEGMPKELQG